MRPLQHAAREGGGRPGHPSSPVLLAPHPAGYDIHTDTYDGTHPGPTGEHKLAGAFADAMHQAWGVGGPYAGALAAA